MILYSVFIIFFFGKFCVNAVDVESIIPRPICFDEEQPNCNQSFIEKYKSLSRSVTNLTDADTFMLLYTRRNPDNPEKLHKCAGRLPPNSNFNPDNRLLLIFDASVLGYCNIAAYREWKIQLLEKEDLNILIVDYAWGNFPDPTSPIYNIRRIVQYQVIILLRNIMRQTGIDKSRIILMGHSLGAQLAGLVGRVIKVSRIIGIDPAGPGHLAAKTPKRLRLDRSDADLVEIWNTDAKKCLPNLGNTDNIGHVNFYFNGGFGQPACFKYTFFSLLRGDYVYGVVSALVPNFCYHLHATQYFKVGINPQNCAFVGVKCSSYEDFKAGKCRSCGSKGENCLIAGWDTDKYVTEIPSTGLKYYIETTLDCPYCNNSYVDLAGYEETYKSALQT